MRLPTEFPNHVWSYDFVAERTRDKGTIKFLNIIDEFNKECLVSYVARKLTSRDYFYFSRFIYSTQLL